MKGVETKGSEVHVETRRIETNSPVTTIPEVRRGVGSDQLAPLDGEQRPLFQFAFKLTRTTRTLFGNHDQRTFSGGRG